jgi:hypothetical protein
MNVLMTVAELLTDPVPLWNWHDKVAWSASLVLAAGGIIGIWIAVRTLKWIKHQSLSARISAEAALQQANHLVASDRAWLTAKVLNFDEPTPNSMMIWIEIPITNHGRTPARVEKIVATSKLVPIPNTGWGRPGELPENPEYSDSNRLIELAGRDIIIAPNDTLRHVHVYIWPREMEQIRSRELSLYVYGQIEYLDTVKGLGHTTSFCSIYWIPEGEFNESTGFMFSQIIPATYFCAT